MTPHHLIHRAALASVILPSLALGAGLAACASPAAPPGAYLYVWAGDSAGQGSDFLAVLGADPASPEYGTILASVPTGTVGGHPHHTEDFVAANDHLLASAFHAGKSFLFDLSEPRAPRILTSFGEVGGYGYPHSYFRTANGNVLATFQYKATGEPAHAMAGHKGMGPPGVHLTGALVEMTERGEVVRVGPAADTAIADKWIFPYSVLQLPAADRAVSTTTSMDEGDTLARSDWIQFWRLSDLTLLRSLRLPAGPTGHENVYTGEPKLLADGTSVYIHTFGCGLYLVKGAEGDAPTAQLVQGFEGSGCGVPVRTGHWWLQPVPDAHALLALDITDPEHPREVARLTFGDDENPHWLAIDQSGRRLVLSSADATSANRIYLIDFDPATGALTLDDRFRSGAGSRPGVPMSQRAWPHGWTGTAAPHGTVFSR